MTLLYVLLILVQGDGSLSEAFPWALVMAAGAPLAVGGAQVSNLGMARALLIGSAAILGLVGYLALLSIGLGFLLAAVVASIGAVRLSTEVP